MTSFERTVIEFARAARPLRESRDVFGWRPATYVQHLHALLERSDVEAAMPVEVHALRRLRDERAAARSSRRFAS